MKGLNRIVRKPLEANRDLSFRISLARSMVDSTPTSTSVTSFALHLVAEFEQVVHQETSNASKKRTEPEKAKVSKLKKLEEEGRSPTKRESKEEKGKCKFFLTDQGCRRGKTCSWSHDQKDDKRRCQNCECPDHMSPACSRPKDRNDQSPQKPKIQKAQGEETSSPTSSTKGKEEEMSSETASMIHVLEQANTMLTSLTSSTSSTSSSTAAGATETKDETMDRLQQQLNQLKFTVFKVNQISHGQHQGLIDSGATHPLRPI